MKRKVLFTVLGIALISLITSSNFQTGTVSLKTVQKIEANAGPGPYVGLDKLKEKKWRCEYPDTGGVNCYNDGNKSCFDDC